MKRILLIAALMLSGCSSPPEPTPVEFDKTKEIIAPSLPYLHDFYGVIPSETDSKGWEYSKTFSKREDFRTPEFYYALAHADRIVVFTSNAGLWFQIRDSLKEQGARGVVQWIYQSSFLSEQVKITFIKTQLEKKND